MHPSEYQQQHHPSRVAALEVLQVKFNLRLQSLVLIALSGLIFLFSVVILAINGGYYAVYFVLGEFVWLTILSIFTMGVYGFFFWKFGDGARSPNFAPTIWHLVVAIVYTILWFSAAIAPITGSGLIGVCAASLYYGGSFSLRCNLADFTDFLAWMAWVAHVIVVLTITAQGQKYSSFNVHNLVPTANVQQHHQPPQVVVADNQGYAGGYNSPQFANTPQIPAH